MASEAVNLALSLRLDYEKAPENEKGQAAAKWLDAEDQLTDKEYGEYIALWSKRGES